MINDHNNFIIDIFIQQHGSDYRQHKTQGTFGWSFLGCFLFGSGVFSFVLNLGSLLPRQFPFTTSRQNTFRTRKAWVFFKNSSAFGLSCVIPLWRWHPKNFSIGSWQSRLLRKNLTPGMVKRYRTSSTKDFTTRWEGKIKFTDIILRKVTLC